MTIKTKVMNLINRARIKKNSESNIISDLKIKIRTCPQKLSPDLMNLLIRNYNQTDSPTDREKISRLLMQRLMLDPSFGSLLKTDYCKKIFGDEALYSHALAAIYFGEGEIDKSITYFEKELGRNPTVINYISLARCFVAIKKDIEAINILKSGLDKYLDNFDLTIALATNYFLLGDTKKANGYVDRVRDNPYFNEYLETTTKLTDEIQVAIKNNTVDRINKNDIYNDIFVKKLWVDYWTTFNTYNGFIQNESWINSIIQEKVGGCLRNNTLSINKVINFGVLCAYPDFYLAKDFPQIEFVGVDRQEITRELNETTFNLRNLTFICGNILDLIPQLKPDSSNTMLYHVRTGCLCYPEFLKRLYKSCYNKKIKYIVIIEHYGLSKHHKAFYNFEDLPAESISFRDIMFNHNYPKFLSDAGYSIVSNERIRNFYQLDKVDRGDAFTCIIAQRKI